jgi:hypothetical protein
MNGTPLNAQLPPLCAAATAHECICNCMHPSVTNGVSCQVVTLFQQAPKNFNLLQLLAPALLNHSTQVSDPSFPVSAGNATLVASKHVHVL